MLKKMALVAAVSVVLALSSCSLGTDEALVGTWDQALYGTTLATFTFTSDGTLRHDMMTMSLNYGYQASGGTGKFWLKSSPMNQLNLSYVITNNVLDLTLADVTMKGLVKH